MKTLHLRTLGAAMSVLLVLAPVKATAQPPIGIISNPPTVHHDGMHGFHRPIFIIEHETIIEREVAPDDKPADPPAAVEPPPPPRKPYVLGKTYASLPGGCMKLIEDGKIYFLCSGEWYRQLGSAQYKAVAKP